MTVDKSKVLDALRRVKGPDLTSNLVDLGLISEVLIKDDRVYFSITVPAHRAQELEALRQAAEKVVTGIDDVAGATVVLTAERGGWRPSVRAPHRAAIVAGTSTGQRTDDRVCVTRAPRERPVTAHPRGRRLRGRPAALAPRSRKPAARHCGHQASDRGRVGQGRRRQIDDGGQSGARPARDRAQGRHHGCGYLRTVAAAAARAYPAGPHVTAPATS